MQHQEAKAKHAKPSGTITKNIFYRHSTTISQEKNMHHRSFHAVTHLCIWWESGPQKWTAGCGSWPYMDISAYSLCSYAWLELFRCFVRNSIKCGTVSWYEPYLSIRFLFCFSKHDTQVLTQIRPVLDEHQAWYPSTNTHRPCTWWTTWQKDPSVWNHAVHTSDTVNPSGDWHWIVQKTHQKLAR